MMNKALSMEMEQLTKDLVSISSVNGTSGEKKIAEFIESYLREIPYFNQHSNNVIIQSLKDDKLDRRNVFAYIKGENNNTGKTIMLHGHMDTVGVDDFGGLKEFASIATAETTDEALTIAMEKLVKFFCDNDDMDFYDAGFLCGLYANLEISQVVDPLKTARMAIDEEIVNPILKKILKKY